MCKGRGARLPPAVTLISDLTLDPLWLPPGKSLRLLRMLNLQRLTSVLDRKMHRVRRAKRMLMTFIISALLLVHWLGCGLKYIAVIQEIWAGDQHVETWMTREELYDLPNMHVWLTCIYWSTMTLTTIGYGDIGLATSGERIYAVICMLIGAASFAFVIGNIVDLLESLNGEKERSVSRSSERIPYFSCVFLTYIILKYKT